MRQCAIHSPGLDTSNSMSMLAFYADNFGLIDLGRPLDVEYGRLRAATVGLGRPIPGNDLWNAASATSNGLPLITLNRRHFEPHPARPAAVVIAAGRHHAVRERGRPTVPRPSRRSGDDGTRTHDPLLAKPDRPRSYPRRQRTAPVEAASALSLGVRSKPVRTAVNGTLVARRRGRRSWGLAPARLLGEARRRQRLPCWQGPPGRGSRQRSARGHSPPLDAGVARPAWHAEDGEAVRTQRGRSSAPGRVRLSKAPLAFLASAPQ
jgi:hypothetical protein